ncbi:MAG: hypothetical protein JOZ78_15285 [Chroococcidiopsidaceae cyanobacterium CP_BM_ER_R8_30]|nr:hypothetical protein [Chroococcidiopsidaceae cyanobacterium CP_BM_ER_R8_30]
MKPSLCVKGGGSFLNLVFKVYPSSSYNEENLTTKMLKAEEPRRGRCTSGGISGRDDIEW